MVSIQLSTNFALFFIGLFGILINSTNALILIICVELLLLSVNLNFILASAYLDDFYGQIFSIFILTIAAAESAIGLAVLILYNRIRGNILINSQMLLKY